MNPVEVELTKLHPPATRDVVDPAKLERMGAFEWSKYKPIIVENDRGRLIIQDGMTRVEAARRAGIVRLPAYVFPKSGS